MSGFRGFERLFDPVRQQLADAAGRGGDSRNTHGDMIHLGIAEVGIHLIHNVNARLGQEKEIENQIRGNNVVTRAKKLTLAPKIARRAAQRLPTDMDSLTTLVT